MTQGIILLYIDKNIDITTITKQNEYLQDFIVIYPDTINKTK